MQAHLRDRRRLHIDGQGIRKIRQDLRILLRAFKKALAGANQTEMHPATGFQTAGSGEQPRIGVKALRQSLDLPREVTLAAPDIVMRRLRPYDDIEQLQTGSERPCTARIDDTVRMFRQYQLRSQPRRRHFPDSGAFHPLNSGTLQSIVLGGHRND